MPEKSIHIGEMIREELQEQGRKVTWFAKQLDCDRTNIYKIFRRDSIDTALLRRISVLLGRDFFKEYSASLK